MIALAKIIAGRLFPMKQSSIRTQFAVLLGLLVCMPSQLGCGTKGPPVGSVAGKVSYKSQPLTTGVVTLLNEKTGCGASGEIDASGSYQIPSLRTGDYNVAVHQAPPAPGAATPKGNWKLNIPEKYQTPQTSGLTATVKEGKNTADFSL
jgi:hypothetical protein